MHEQYKSNQRINSSIEHLAALAQNNGCSELLEFIIKGVEVPALIMLELYRPIIGLGDAIYIFSQPFLKAFSYQHSVLEVLRDRAAVDWLINELEKSANRNKYSSKN